MDHPPLDSISADPANNDEPLWQTILGCVCFAVLYGLILLVL